MIAVIIRVTGEEIAVRVSKPGDKDPARIRYRAVGASDAITDLGHSTVVGIIFSHLIEHGPCTAREIRAEKPFTDKSVQSAIDKLKRMHLVQGELISG